MDSKYYAHLLYKAVLGDLPDEDVFDIFLQFAAEGWVDKNHEWIYDDD